MSARHGSLKPKIDLQSWRKVEAEERGKRKQVRFSAFEAQRTIVSKTKDFKSAKLKPLLK